jgi:hypothetical protein
MLAGMRSSLIGVFATAAILVASCGGKAIGPAQVDDSGIFGRNADSSDDGNNYVNPKCPDAGTPPVDDTCNVFDPNGCIGESCCPPDSACYPVVIPPQGPCDTETYGSFCLQVGTGTQGASCDGTENCAGGFVCLITGASTQCAQMCSLDGSHGCPSGFVCEPIDVTGFAACL